MSASGNIVNLGLGFINGVTISAVFFSGRASINEGLACFAVAALATCLSKREYQKAFLVGSAIGALRVCSIMANPINIYPIESTKLPNQPAVTHSLKSSSFHYYHIK